MKRLFWVLLGTLLVITLFSSAVVGVMVQPMVFKYTAKRGQTIPFAIKIASREKYPEMVQLSLVQPSQKLNGAFEFKPANSGTFPQAKWVSLNVSEITIPVGEEREIKGKIKIPSDAKGYHLVAIMIKQAPHNKSGALLASVQYAVRFEIKIDAPLPKTTAEITDFELVKGAQGQPLLQFKAKNSSLLLYGTDASVMVRNTSTKKLIERIQLKPEFYLSNNTEPVMIPGATLEFVGTPKEAIVPDQYELQLVFRFGTSGQILMKKIVAIKPGDFIYPAKKLKTVQMDDNVAFSANPGGISLKGIKLENKSNKKVKVVFEPLEIGANYPYSLLKNTLLDFKNGQTVIIEPGRTVVAVVTVKFPKDASPQGNYCQLKATTFMADGTQTPIEESLINLEAVTRGKLSIAAIATNVTVAPNGKKCLLSVIVKNTGGIKIIPKATLYLKNDKGKSVDSVQLTMQDNDSPVLPIRLATITGITNETLTPGNYHAEVKIFNNGEEIGHSSFDIPIN